MDVTVEFSTTGEQAVMEVSETETLGEFKARALERFGFDPEDMRLRVQTRGTAGGELSDLGDDAEPAVCLTAGDIVVLSLSTPLLCPTSYTGHDLLIDSIAVSPCGKKVYSTSQDGTLRVWLTSSAACEKVLRPTEEVITQVIASPCGTLLFARCADAITVLRTEDWEVAQTIASQASTAMAVSGNSKHLAVARDSRVKVVATEDWADALNLSHAGPAWSYVAAVALSADGSRVYAGGGKVIKVASVLSGHIIATCELPCHRLAAAPSGNLYVVTGEDARVLVLDSSLQQTGTVLDATGASNGFNLQDICLSPCGSWLWARGYGLTAWDTETGRCVGRCRGLFLTAAAWEGYVFYDTDEKVHVRHVDSLEGVGPSESDGVGGHPRAPQQWQAGRSQESREDSCCCCS